MATKFLDNTGLTYLWGKIKYNFATHGESGDDIVAADKAMSIPFGQVDSTSTSTVFTATVDGITELRDGVCVLLKNGVVNSAAGYTININGLGAKPVYNSTAAASATSTLFTSAYTLFLIYDSTRVSGGCWVAYYGYYQTNSDTTAYQTRHQYTSLPVSDYLGRYRFMFTSADGSKHVPATTSTSTNTTSLRDVNQRPINPFGEITYYGSTTAVNAGSRPGATVVWNSGTNVNLGYSFNRTGAALALSYYAPVYIKCKPLADGSAIIDADEPYVQALPKSEDGYIYIFLGLALSATNLEFPMYHPIYYYKRGEIRLWTGSDDDFDIADDGYSFSVNVPERDGKADVNRLAGNTVAWNSLISNDYPSSATTENCTAAFDTSNKKITLTLSSASGTRRAYSFNKWKSYAIVNGHKYASIVSIAATEGVKFRFSNLGATAASLPTVGCTGSGSGSKHTYYHIGTSSSNYSDYFCIYINSGNVNDTVTIYDNTLIDLTRMFGPGKEPETADVFEAWLKNHISSLDYYANNTGELLNVTATKFDTTGFNLYDWRTEETKTLIYGEKYQLTGTYTSFEDGNDVPVVLDSDGVFVADTEAKVFASIEGGDTTTCLHLVKDGSRNGEFEAYNCTTHNLNITTLTGKLNGEGASVIVFLDGMKSTGTVKDEIVCEGGVTKAIKRIGAVDLGTLTWTYDTGYTRFMSSNIQGLKYSEGARIVPIICNKYVAIYDERALSNVEDKSVYASRITPYPSMGVYVHDSAYTNAATFKTAMSGVMLYYELATPEEYVLDDQSLLPITFNQDRWGENIMYPVNGSGPTSLSPIMDVTYKAKEYITKEEITTLIDSKHVVYDLGEISDSSLWVDDTTLGEGGKKYIGSVTETQINADVTADKEVKLKVSNSIYIYVGQFSFGHMFVMPLQNVSDLEVSGILVTEGYGIFYTKASYTETDPTVPSHVKSITTTDISNWNGKQAAISDLATIRSGAALGATALQSYTETDPVFTASAAHGITSSDISNWNGKQMAMALNTQGSTTSKSVDFDNYYRFTATVNTLAVTLPSTATLTDSNAHSIILEFTTGSSPNVTFSSANSATINYFDGFNIEASTEYEVNALWNGSKWILARTKVVSSRS